jgi:CBS domain-containing protein
MEQLMTKKVKELMLALDDYATVPSDATLQQALVALSKAQMGLTNDRHHHRAVLVLDDAGRVVGKLTHWAILRSLEPSFFGEADRAALSRSNLSPEFIQGLERRFSGLGRDLSATAREAARVRVRDAMIPVRESIDEEAGLSEAIRMMVLGHWQSLLVTRGGDVAGILRLSDVFEEVADLIRGATPPGAR